VSNHHYLHPNRLKAPINWPERYRALEKNAPDGPLKDYYKAGLVAMDCPLKDTPMVSLDLETTGLNSDKDTIISVGLMPMTTTRIQCNGAKYWMVKPASSLSAKSVTIHEITHADIATSPDLTTYFAEILAALAQKVVVVHCVDIERPFLLAASLQHYGYPLYFPVLDTMQIEMSVPSSLPWYQQLFKKPTSVRLDVCRQRYQLPRYKAHHALTDALATGELLQAQSAHHLEVNQPISHYWV